MNKIFCFFIACCCNTNWLQAQNVGIGTTTPAFPLSFSNTVGNKIGLWGTSGNHYGLGVQSALLQMYSDLSTSNIAFGHGSSASFTERMRIINSGVDGMVLNGRLMLRNGTSPINPLSGPGVWLYRPDNSGLGGFMGVQNNESIGFYGVNTGWGLVYNVDNGRVGLGTSAPVNRLDVAGLNNWDLTNTEGDIRIGNDNHRLKFGVALAGGGSGAANIMQAGGVGVLSLGAGNKYFIQLNGPANFVDLTNLSGGLRFNGQPGTAGQVLQSNGSSSSPKWVTKPGAPYVLTYTQPTVSQLFDPGVLFKNINGLHDQYFTLANPSSIVFTANAWFSGDFVTTSFGYLQIMILNAFNQSVGAAKAFGFSIDTRRSTVTAVGSVNLPAGTYHTQVRYHRASDLDGNMNINEGIVVIQVIPN